MLLEETDELVSESDLPCTGGIEPNMRLPNGYATRTDQPLIYASTTQDAHQAANHMTQDPAILASSFRQAHLSQLQQTQHTVNTAESSVGNPRKGKRDKSRKSESRKQRSRSRKGGDSEHQDLNHHTSRDMEDFEK
jgi:hypothetical protein